MYWTRGTFIAPESSNAPVLPSPDAILSTSPPAVVMLDHVAYIGGDDIQKNGTFAQAITRTGPAIGVSLWVTDPPAVSHLCVHCPSGGLKVTDIYDEPTVLYSGKDVIIIRVIFNPGFRTMESIDEMGMSDCDYLAYRPHADPPSLVVLPSPKLTVFHPWEIRFSPCGGSDGDDGGGEFILAVLRSRLVYLQYDLHVFSSKTNRWTTRLAMLEPPWPGYMEDYLEHERDVVLTLDRGLLAWVDLWRGILLCNVLDTEPVVRYVEFPKPMDGNMRNYLQHEARTILDVAYRDGVIKLVEMENRMRPLPIPTATAWARPSDGYHVSADGWSTVTWCRELSADCWRLDCTEYVSASSIVSQMRQNRSERKALNSLVMAGPLWSMHRGDVVYLMAKTEFQDIVGWAIAFNTRNSTLDGVTPFQA